jgi:4-amino-4-deoxy-L-arabinose transferase-like glycosyltransferase
MSPGLDHDWHAVFANPKPNVGERTKVRLMIILCALWVIFGLVGHSPWKPDELQSISIIKHLLESGDWLIPMMAGEPTLKNPPLYYLSAALFAKLFSPLLTLHDAARLVTGVWMALTLLFVGMTGRELWGAGSGRQAALIFISSIGMVFSAHMISPEVAGLTSYAMVFYSLALAPRRPLRAGLILGLGTGIGFLAKGLLNLEVMLITALLLPLLFDYWRRRSYLHTLGIMLLVAIPWIAPWLILLRQKSPDLFQTWLTDSRVITNHTYYVAKTLIWYSWPALPLAIWALWRIRPNHSSLQIALLFFLVQFTILGTGINNNDVYMLPFLLPLTLLATPAVDKLQRSVASALNWFGVMLFGTLAVLVWTGWVAMMTGVPTKLAGRAHILSSSYVPHFNFIATALAIALTLLWAAVVFKSHRSNRATVTDWAVGMTMAWGLVMTLWLPWLDAAKSYQPVFAAMQKTFPVNFACVTARDLGPSQRAALDYYLNLKVQRFELSQTVSCDLYLIEDERDRQKIEPGNNWKMIWEGKRPSDRHEKFRLFQYVS